MAAPARASDPPLTSMGGQDNIAVPRNAIVCGDALAVLRDLPDESVQMCVTSPPYWGLRSYGTEPVIYGAQNWCGHEWSDHQQMPNGGRNLPDNMPNVGGNRTQQIMDGPRFGVLSHFCLLCGAWRGQLGLEPSPEMYVAHMVEIFREVRRVLRRDGTLWLNMGDCYAGGQTGRGDSGNVIAGHGTHRNKHDGSRLSRGLGDLKPKDLCMIPARLAIALQADGWWLRSDIIWAKPNPMPESVTDRPTRAHEYVFLMTKAARYFYDADAIREPAKYPTTKMPDGWNTGPGAHGSIHPEGREKGVSIRAPKLSGGRMGIEREMNVREYETICGANARSVWTISTAPFAEAHFATFPPELARRCILAGSPPQCCGVCGAPWVRIIKRQMRIVNGRREQRDYPGSPGQRSGKVPGSNTRGYPNYSDLLLGFRPTCKHDDGTGHALVLDPFMGAGTVGVVCKELGRDYIGVELSEKYCDMAERRIRGEFGPEFKERAAMENAGQVTLL